METILKTSKDLVTDSYKTGSATDKALLEKLFGKFLKPVTERINSFEDACQETGKDPDQVRPFKNPVNADQEALNAIAEIWVIIEAANEGKEIDWKNSNQYKYTPYFDMTSEGLVFVTVYDWDSYSYVGSRLCFLDSDTCEHFARKFIKTYQKFMVR